MAATLCCLASSYYTETIPSSRLKVKTSSMARSARLGQFVDHCSEQVDRLLGFRNVPTKALLVKEVQQDDPGKDDAPYQVLLKPGMGIAEMAFQLYAELVMRRCDELPGEAGMPEAVRASLHWMAAGLTHQLLAVEMGGAGLLSEDYEVARNEYTHGRFPDLSGLLLGGPAPEFKPLFELYMLHCDLLVMSLNTVRGTGGEPFRELLLAEKRGVGCLQAFDQVFGRFYGHGESRQAFYERLVSQKSRQRHHGSGLETIDERVAELETVAVVEPGGAGIKRVRLEELPRELEDYKLDERAVLRLEQTFTRLREDAPYFLQAPLTEYISALELLRQGKDKRFKVAFQEARKNFQLGIVRQKQVEELLNEAERRGESQGSHWEDYLTVIGRYHRLSDGLFPGGGVFQRK